MSVQYCDVCGQHVEVICDGKVRECGLADSGQDTGDDFGYMSDCPFDNDLTIEDYDEEIDWDDSEYIED